MRLVLRQECLFGEDEGILPDGTHVGLGLLIEQLADYVPNPIDLETFVEMVRLVRRQPDGPGPDECFTLRWFRIGDRLGRVESEARRTLFRRTLAENAPDFVAEFAKSKRMPFARPQDRATP